MHAGDGVDRGATQRVAQHVGLDSAAEGDVEADALFAASADQGGEALAEGPVDERQCPAAHAVAHRHLHEAGSGGGADQHGTLGPSQRAEARGDALEELLHPRRTMADHRPRHRGQDLGMNVGGTGKKELAERHRHAVARANSSTSPPTTTSLVFTRRTPSSPHSRSRCSATSRSIGFIASATAKTRMWGRCSSKPSMAYRTHTSSATPYSTMSWGSRTSSTGRTFGFVNTSNRCLWNRMSLRGALAS